MISNPILIVDDEVEMRIAMSETLKHCGYPVELSHNAIDALKKYKENDYSMVITDMTMPKRSGLELLKDIKRLDSAKPVIMATAYATVETAVEAMKHGAFDYIKKPIDFDSFLFLVERALAFKGHTGSMVPLEEAKPIKGRVTETSKEIVTQNQEMESLLDVSSGHCCFRIHFQVTWPFATEPSECMFVYKEVKNHLDAQNLLLFVEPQRQGVRSIGETASHVLVDQT